MDTGCVLMAKVKCKVCGEEVEEDIPKCPRCDSLGPKRGKRIKIILLVVMLLIVAGFATSYYLRMDEVEKPYEEIEKERHDEKLQRRALTAALMLRSQIDDSQSMKLESVQSNVDGSVLCFQFMEKNSQGKLVKSRASFVDGEMDRSDAGWKLFCNGKNLRPVKVESPVLN